MRKKVSKKSKRRLMIFGIPSAIMIVYFCVTFTSYIYMYFSLQSEKEVLNNNLYSLQEEKKNLKNEIVKLNDPNYIIRYAKEYYLYSTEGEYVIKLDEENKEEVNVEDNNSSIYVIAGIVIFSLGFIVLKKISKSKK